MHYVEFGNQSNSQSGSCDSYYWNVNFMQLYSFYCIKCKADYGAFKISRDNKLLGN